MSKWIGAIAGNVESLLDKVDQAAGQALHKVWLTIGFFSLAVLFFLSFITVLWKHKLTSVNKGHFLVLQADL